jgi:hypothetical protein
MSAGVHSCRIRLARNPVARKTHVIINAMSQKSNFIAQRDPAGPRLSRRMSSGKRTTYSLSLGERVRVRDRLVSPSPSFHSLRSTPTRPIGTRSTYPSLFPFVPFVVFCKIRPRPLHSLRSLRPTFHSQVHRSQNVTKMAPFSTVQFPYLRCRNGLHFHPRALVTFGSLSPCLCVSVVCWSPIPKIVKIGAFADFQPIRPRGTNHLQQIKIGVRRFSTIRASSFFRHSSFVIRHYPSHPALVT